MPAMKKQVLALLAGGALVAFVSAANAAEVTRLNDHQMDAVSAGAAAIANTAALALGEALADTITQSNTYVQTVANPPPTSGGFATGRIAIAQGFAQALAGGGFLFQSGAAVHVDTAASWP
jgi:hypothetical protein